MFEQSLKLSIVSGTLKRKSRLFLIVWGLLFGGIPSFILIGTIATPGHLKNTPFEGSFSNIIFPLPFMAIGFWIMGTNLLGYLKDRKLDRLLKEARQRMPYILYLIGAQLTGLSVNNEPEIFLTFEGDSGIFEQSIYAPRTVYLAFEQYLREVESGERQLEGVPAYLVDDTLYMSYSELVSNIGHHWSKAQPLHKEL